MTDATSYDDTERAQDAKRLLEALDGFEKGTVSLHALRRRAAAYKQRLGGGARRTHEECIRDMNTNRVGWLITMRGNTRFLEANARRDFDAKQRGARRP